MEEGLVVHSDGGSRGNPGPGACAFTVEENGRVVGKDSKYLGHVTNNFAEYSGVVLALTWITANRNRVARGKINFYLDSELVAKQLSGLYKIKNKNLLGVSIEIKTLITKKNLEIVFKNIPREKNKLADAMVNQELDNKLSGKFM